MFTFTNTEWLESSFQKRECVRIVPSVKDSTRCCCGLAVSAHSTPLLNDDFLLGGGGGGGGEASSSRRGSGVSTRSAQIGEPGEHWNPSRHTVPLPTDAYGCIDFRGGSQTNKAQYIRLAYDTKPELVLTLLLREWGLEKPKLLITVNGGKANFELQPRLKRSLRKGLLKAAKTTGAWIFTGGTNTGVTEIVGDALVTEKSPRIKGGRVVSIGITPWGIVEKRNELVGKKTDIPFHSVAQPRSRFVTLNKHHAYFLLVDNGTVGKYGAEIALKRKLEKFISTQRLSANFSTPLVCLVIEGGTNTIRAVLEYVTDTPPVPVVVCDGTGRAADLIAFAHKYAGEDGDPGLLDEMHDQLRVTIQKTFNVAPELAAKLHEELIQCVKRKHLITIFRCSGERGEDELDQVIMTALFKARHLSPVEQLSLALAWNRCDIARKEIFIYGQEWPCGALEQATQEALESDRVDFVRLLLDNGVDMNKFLTIARLEQLYNSKNGPANTLEYLVRDVVHRMTKSHRYTLIEIGLVINNLMGNGFRSSYTRRKFRVRYECATQSERNAAANNCTNLSSPIGGHNAAFLPASSSTSLTLKRKRVHLLKKNNTENSIKLPTLSLPPGGGNDSPGSYEDYNSGGGGNNGGSNGLGGGGGNGGSGNGGLESYRFEYPFSELIIWAVLTKRKEMAKLMWQHGEQALSKALVASRLCQAMADEAADDDLDVEIYEELSSFGKEFEELSLQLLDFCYHLDDDLTQHLLTASLDNWSRKTCLSLAVIAQNLKFLAHPISQAILADLWMGGLRMRKNPIFKIILGLLCPPSIAKLEFKTREELELMPQTEEELQDRDDNNSSATSSSSEASSRRSSIQGTNGLHAEQNNDADELVVPEKGIGVAGTASALVARVGSFRSGSRSKRRSTSRKSSGCCPDPETGGGGLGLKVGATSATSDCGGSVIGGNASTGDAGGETEIFINDMSNMAAPLNFSCFSRVDPQMKKKTRPLKLKKKLYEFYSAPITKYYSHCGAYALFLGMFTYICLVRTPLLPNWPELYVVACQVAFGCEALRTYLSAEPFEFSMKLKVWLSDCKWYASDAIAICIFLVTFGLRFDRSMIPVVHATYSCVICYWYIRSLKLIGVNKHFGPYVVMIGKMIENMIYFIVLLLVVLMAFGVCRQSILYPNEEPDWRLVSNIFFQPYFMLYGEVFAPDIDPECNPDCEVYGECGTTVDGALLVPCHTGRWITPIVMTIYLLVANILLINLLIASFNTIYNRVSAVSQQIFNFQRFGIVMEYEEKPILPVPFIIVSHAHLAGKHFYRKIKGINTRFESGLKLVLGKFDMERLYDFEEEGVEGLMRSKEEEEQQNITSKMKGLMDVSEELKSKLYDLERWEGMTQDTTQSLELRLQRIEEMAEQTTNQLTVIHRFMTATNAIGLSLSGSNSDIDGDDGSNVAAAAVAAVGTAPAPAIRATSPRPPPHLHLDHLAADPAAGPTAPISPRPPPIPSPGVGARAASLELELRGIERKSSFSRMRTIPLAKTSGAIEEADSEGNASTPALSKQETLESEDAAQEKEPPQPSSHPTKPPPRPRYSSCSSDQQGTAKLRHASSGGSSAGPIGPIPADQQPEQGGLRRRGRTSSSYRRNRHPTTMTESSEDNDHQHRMATLQHQTSIMVDDSELPYADDDNDHIDGGDGNGDAATISREARMIRQMRFARSQSECVPTPGAATGFSRYVSVDSGGRKSSVDESGESTVSLGMKAKAYASKRSNINARRRKLTTRDYTSITDELEMQISTPIQDSASTPPQPLQAIKMETEKLRGAEEADYNLMEKIIERRLRRDDSKFGAESLDELAVKSVMESEMTFEQRTSDNDAKPESTEEDLLTPPWGPDPPHPPPPATSWTESLNRMQTLPAPRHKEGSVRIRLAADADRVEVEFVDEVDNVGGATDC